MIIRRRLFACYLIFGLGLLFLIYSLNSVYSDHYEVSSEAHIRNAFQVPDPFPKGKPDFRKIHEEEMRQAEEERRKEEERRQQKVENERKKVEEDQQMKSKEQKQRQQKKEKLEAEAQLLEKELEDQTTLEDDATSDEATVTALLTDDEPSAEQAQHPLSVRIATRAARYQAWMRVFRKLSSNDKSKISNKFQERYLAMEQKDAKGLAEPVVSADTDEDDTTTGKSKLTGDKIVILTAADARNNKELQIVVQKARENRKEYAAYHGYTEYFVNLTKFTEAGRPSSWDKISAIKEAFDANPTADWVWMLDPGVLIMNPEVDLAKHILSPEALKQRLTYARPLRNSESNFMNGLYMNKGEVDPAAIDVVISQDYFGINTGSFFLKRSGFTSLLLDIWDDPTVVRSRLIRQQQDALVNLFVNHARLQQHFGLVPQRVLNSYPESPEWPWSYQPGDLVINLDCASSGSCMDLWKSYWETRDRVPESYRVGGVLASAATAGGSNSIVAPTDPDEEALGPFAGILKNDPTNTDSNALVTPGVGTVVVDETGARGVVFGVTTTTSTDEEEEEEEDDDETIVVTSADDEEEVPAKPKKVVSGAAAAALYGLESSLETAASSPASSASSAVSVSGSAGGSAGAAGAAAAAAAAAASLRDYYDEDETYDEDVLSGVGTAAAAATAADTKTASPVSGRKAKTSSVVSLAGK